MSIFGTHRRSRAGLISAGGRSHSGTTLGTALTKPPWNNSPFACKGLKDDTQGGYSCPTGMLPSAPLEKTPKTIGLACKCRNLRGIYLDSSQLGVGRWCLGEPSGCRQAAYHPAASQLVVTNVS